MGRKKKVITSNIEIKQKTNIEKIEIEDRNKLPTYKMRGFALLQNDTIEDCIMIYKRIYNINPDRYFLYVNSQEHKIAYFDIPEDKR